MARTPTFRGEVLMARFLDFAYDKKEVRSTHISLYAHIITTYNKLGWPEWFQLQTELAMQRAKVSNRKTYFKLLKQLMEWGWIKEAENRARTATRQICLTQGIESDAYGSALAYDDADNTQDSDAAPKTAETPQTDESPNLERFDLVFDAWSTHVLEDKRWLATVKDETGIVNFALAFRLFKEHIIRLSKTDDFLSKNIYDKKSYFLFASKHFVTDECKHIKNVVATIIVMEGKSYARQFGSSVLLPDNYPPQPDVDYYWDAVWKAWRRA